MLKATTIYIAFFIIVLLLGCRTKTTYKKYNDLTDSDYEHRIDTVDGEEVFYKSATSQVDPAQKFRALNNQQKMFIKEQLNLADTFLQKFQNKINIYNYTPENLDNIALWNEDSSKFNSSKSAFVNAIGVAFGTYLINKYKMTWAIVSDSYGEDYATTLAEFHFSNFPLNSVLKAIDQNREGSLQQIYLLTKRDIIEMRKEEKKE